MRETTTSGEGIESPWPNYHRKTLKPYKKLTPPTKTEALSCEDILVIIIGIHPQIYPNIAPWGYMLGAQQPKLYGNQPSSSRLVRWCWWPLSRIFPRKSLPKSQRPVRCVGDLRCFFSKKRQHQDGTSWRFWKADEMYENTAVLKLRKVFDHCRHHYYKKSANGCWKNDNLRDFVWRQIQQETTQKLQNLPSIHHKKILVKPKRTVFVGGTSGQTPFVSKCFFHTKHVLAKVSDVNGHHLQVLPTLGRKSLHKKQLERWGC